MVFFPEEARCPRVVPAKMEEKFRVGKEIPCDKTQIVCAGLDLGFYVSDLQQLTRGYWGVVDKSGCHEFVTLAGFYFFKSKFSFFVNIVYCRFNIGSSSPYC